MDKVIVHLHVPKCAGSSVNKVLSDHFGRRCLAYDNPDQRAAFLEMSQSERDEKYSAVIGHVKYGLGEMFGKDVIYLSATRPSIERILSYFNYIHLTQDHPLHGLFRSQLLSFNDLSEDFLINHPVIMSDWSNAYCRTYFGRPVEIVPDFNKCRAMLFERMREGTFILGSLNKIERYLKREKILIQPKLPVINKAADKVADHEFEVATINKINFNTLALLNKINMFDNVLMDKIAEFEMKRRD